MLTSYGGDNYKDADKVNKHIKEVAVEKLPVTNSFDELLPDLSPEQKFFVLQSLGFKPFHKSDGERIRGKFVHPTLEPEILNFDVQNDLLSSIVEKIKSVGWEEAFRKYNVIGE